MFEYAFARRLAFETESIVKLDSENGFKRDFFERDYSLSNFNIVLAPAGDMELRKYRFFNGSYSGRAFEKLNSSFKTGMNYIVKEEKYFGFYDNLLSIKGERYYDGYWQNLNYFECIREILLEEFELNIPMAGKPAEISAEIEGCESAGIHIRKPHAFKGDLIDKRTMEIFEIVEAEYYIKAVEMLKLKVPEARLFVFTEDLVYANALLKGINYEKIICGKQHEDMVLMSRCRHQIISNSTFSWWSAWLNRNCGKIVIAPRYWFKDRNLCPESLLKDLILI